jgi:peptidoglycan hydrolase-like protein with peptidoglycan-binding domain
VPGLIGNSPFVSRAEWGARAPKSVSNNITPQGNTIHYEGPHMGPYSHDRCVGMMQGIQNYHMNNNGWADIAYSSMVCQHGYIFECRWLHHRTAAQGTNEGNQISYAHCALLGVDDPPSPECLRGLHDVVIYFKGQGSGDRLWGHRDWHPTGCPGEPLQNFVHSGAILADVPGAVTPPGQPQPPPPPAQVDWYEEMIMALPTLDFNRPFASALIDNIQGLLKGTQNGGCDPGAIDNQYGPRTMQAVKAFQRMAGLGDDGIVGPKTWRKLIEW